MTDHITRAAAIVNEANWKADFKGGARADEIARALDGAGLLASPEHDAAVAARALREAAPRFRHDRPSASVWAEMLDLADQIEAGESGADA